MKRVKRPKEGKNKTIIGDYFKTNIQTLTQDKKILTITLTAKYFFDDYPENFKANLKRSNGLFKKFWYNHLTSELKSLKIDEKWFIFDFQTRDTGDNLGENPTHFEIDITCWFKKEIDVRGDLAVMIDCMADNFVYFIKNNYPTFVLCER